MTKRTSNGDGDASEDRTGQEGRAQEHASLEVRSRKNQAAQLRALEQTHYRTRVSLTATENALRRAKTEIVAERRRNAARQHEWRERNEALTLACFRLKEALRAQEKRIRCLETDSTQTCRSVTATLTDGEGLLACLRDDLRESQDYAGWLKAELATQVQARQLLEATISNKYPETIASAQQMICAHVPMEASVLVVSKGDNSLLDLYGRPSAHFPQNEAGEYAGYHPADSDTAIAHLNDLIRKGAKFLLVPNTAFWWFEFYEKFTEHLNRMHHCVESRESCVLYRLNASPPNGSDSKGDASTDFIQLSTPLLAGCFNVVCFPIIDWSFRFQRPQQLMSLFAKAGHRVVYLSHSLKRKGDPCHVRSLGDNLFEIFLGGAHRNTRLGTMDKGTADLLTASLFELGNVLRPETTIAFVESPIWWPVVSNCVEQFRWPVVYDCLDYHQGFRTANLRAKDWEDQLVINADLVTVTSEFLAHRSRSLNGNVILVRNGCDFEHFSNTTRKKRSTRPVIGYYGAISEWFDTDLVEELAERRADWDFILVGSTVGADVSRLAQLPNVLLAGEKCYQELPEWLARFDVAIMPFKRNQLTEATNPVKAYEIFASGTPFVSVPLPELLLMAPLVRLASTADEFERAIASELNDVNSDMNQRRRQFAQLNTWQQRFESLQDAIGRLLRSRPRVP